MTPCDIILLTAGVALAIPIALLALQTLAAVLQKDQPHNQPSQITPRPSLAVIIPAHNEAPVISQTIASILPQLLHSDQLLVIADNCTDDTATIAKSNGATVIQRHDLSHRGKGYALAAAIQSLQNKPPAVVVIIDADTSIAPGTINTLITQTILHYEPCQAAYLLNLPPNPTTRARLSAFAFTFKNLIRARGSHALGIPCLLRGTGMAFPWAAIHSAHLATGNLVEDMQLGIDLAIVGHAPIFCPAALVTGTLPQAASAAKPQRTRWEHGHLLTIFRNLPRLLWHAVTQCRPSLIALALDLAIPPLALLALIWLAATCLAAATFYVHLSSFYPLLLLLSSGILLLLTILLAWSRFARQLLPVASLISVPFYILWKVPLYAAFLFRRQKTWVRTQRLS